MIWLDQIEEARKREEQWRQRAEKVVERYRDDRSKDDDTYRMNILYSNTDVLMASLYPRTPQPDVRRRWKADDPVGREAAIILERGLSYFQDMYHFDSEVQAALQDYLLPGRGGCRVNVDVETAEVDGYDTIVDQRFYVTAFSYKDLVIGPGRKWDEVDWIAFRLFVTKDEAGEKFPNEAAKLSFVWGRDDKKDEHDPDANRALVYEVWDKEGRERFYVSSGIDDRFEVEPDPLGLEGFFPTPEPLYAVRTSGSLIPIPEFTLYQDQVQILDIVTQRIARLTDALKRRGVYDSSMPALENLADADDNTFIPVESYAALMEKGGLAGIMQEAPIENIAKILMILRELQNGLVETIYELTGISDIMRGQAADRETATTSRTKDKYGSLRVKNRRREVKRFIRDLVRMKAELIAEHIEPAILEEITQRPVTPEVMKVLREDRLRGFRIDVETDETAEEEDLDEKRLRMEALETLGVFIERIAPLVQSGVLPQDAAKELGVFALAPWKGSRQFETLLDAMSVPQPQQQQSGGEAAALAQAEVAKEQMRSQVKAAELQHKAQADQQKFALDGRRQMLEEAKFQHSSGIDLKKFAHDQGVDIAKLQLEAQKIDVSEQQVLANIEANRERVAGQLYAVDNQRQSDG